MEETLVHIPFDIQPVRIYVLIKLQIILRIFQFFPELAGHIPALQIPSEKFGQHTDQPADLLISVDLRNPINGLKDIKKKMGIHLGLKFMIPKFQ